MMYILATTRTGQEFTTAEAINRMMHRPDPDGDLRPAGALAVVPRRIVIVQGKDGKSATYEYRPFLPNYVFLAMDELLWSRIIGRNKDCILRDDRARTIPPPFHQDDILPRTWADFQAFAHRAELACARRIEQIERGDAVARYRRGDKLRILGDMTQGQLRAEVATFLRLDAKGRIVAESVGVEVFGKPFTMTLDAVQVEAIAAE